MYTDGGSIPKVAQAIPGLSPWGYGPAYLVHDWAFELHHCHRAGRLRPDQRATDDMGFEDSVRLLAQAMHALERAGRIRPGTRAPSLITAAVGSGIARDLWSADGLCATSPAFAELSARYDLKVNGPAGPPGTKRIAPRPRPTDPGIVAVLSF